MKRILKICILTLAVLTLALPAALAEEIVISDRVQAIRLADKALEEKYGITLLTQEYFERDTEDGEDGDGDGEVALAAGEHVLEGRLLEAGEPDVRQGLAGELRAVAGVVPRDGRRCLPALGDGGGRDDGCGLAHGVPPSGS